MISLSEIVRQVHPPYFLRLQPLERPVYYHPPADYSKVMLATEDMARDVTDEGWQLALGLQHAGYHLHGYRIGPGLNSVNDILKYSKPDVVVVQDQREWDKLIAHHRHSSYNFTGLPLLAQRDDIFKITVIKDAHQRAVFHRGSAQTMGCHAWITYYHPAIVRKIAPYLRQEHIIRTYHSVDPRHVPTYQAKDRLGCVISGAVSTAYPLRQRIIRNIGKFTDMHHLAHPGYRNTGCHTPKYIRTLSNFKVSICTTSIYGYALRKIIESTAAGCRVITNLTVGDVLPGIDENLIRVHPHASVETLVNTVNEAVNSYDPEKQEHFSNIAKAQYDYKALGVKLYQDIEHMRENYNSLEPYL